MAKHLVSKIDDVTPDSVRKVVVDGEEICLARTEDGDFHAIGDVCTHEQYSLSDGELWGMDVECPVHGSRFNVATGAVTGLPAVVPAKVYRVTVEGDDVYVEI